MAYANDIDDEMPDARPPTLLLVVSEALNRRAVAQRNAELDPSHQRQDEALTARFAATSK
jgi:hypothetical protein